MRRDRKPVYAPITKDAKEDGGIDYYWEHKEFRRWKHRKNEEESIVYCPYCGFCCRDLGIHLQKAHKIHPKNYRIKYGMTQKAQMTSPSTHIRRINANLQKIKDGIISPREKTLSHSIYETDREREGV